MVEPANQPGLPPPAAKVIPCALHWWYVLHGLLEPLPTALKVCLLPLLTGCSAPVRIESPERLDQGYVLVLPGVEGQSYLNENIARGLENGQVPYAIEVYDWTTGSVALLPITLRGLERNRGEAAKIAAKIMAYQDAHPGQPVHIVGHSGGGGLAVLALEALPPEHAVTSIILLAPALSPDYDLCRAIRRTQLGIWNFFSPYDRGFLAVGTFVMGTLDGKHTASAGQRGFVLPRGLDAQRRQLYLRVHQFQFDSQMAEDGHNGGHTGWAQRSFVATHIAALINRQRSPQSQPASAPTASQPAPLREN